MDIENKLKNLCNFKREDGNFINLDNYEDTCGFGCPDCKGKVYGKHLSGELKGTRYRGCVNLIEEKIQKGIYSFNRNSIEKV